MRSYAGCPPGCDHRNPPGQRSNMNGSSRTRKAAVASSVARNSIRCVSRLIFAPVLRAAVPTVGPAIWVTLQSSDMVYTFPAGTPPLLGRFDERAIYGTLPAHHGSCWSRWKNPPTGPSGPNVASRTLVLAPSLTSIGAASLPRSVFTQPGWAALTLIGVSRSSLARRIVYMFSAALEGL